MWMDDSSSVIGVGPRQANTALSLLTWSTGTDGPEAHPLFKKSKALILLLDQLGKSITLMKIHHSCKSLTWIIPPKQHKMSLSELLVLSEWATMDCKWLHFLLNVGKKYKTALMFHEIIPHFRIASFSAPWRIVVWLNHRGIVNPHLHVGYVYACLFSLWGFRCMF